MLWLIRAEHALIPVWTRMRNHALLRVNNHICSDDNKHNTKRNCALFNCCEASHVT